MIRILAVINWKEEGKWYFLRSMRKRVKEFKVIQPVIPKKIKGHLWNKINIILSEFYLPFLALKMHKQFDIVISWQLRIGVFYGILNQIFSFMVKMPSHIIQDFHIDLTRKDLKYILKLLILKISLKGIDHFLCTSNKEKKIYSDIFNIPENKISFLPYYPPSDYLNEYNYPVEDYIFSYGNSDRNYNTLIEAVKGLNQKVIILSQKFLPKQKLPSNIIHINYKIPEQELIRLIASSKMIVLPLKDFFISAGQISMLQSMALGRPVIVSANMATIEYAKHCKTALYFKADNPDELHEHIIFLLENTEVAEKIGQNAHKQVLSYPELTVNIFTNIIDR